MSERLTKWAIELSEYDVNFINIVTIKGKAITDFIAELTQVDAATTWVVEVDGFSCSVKVGKHLDQCLIKTSLHIGRGKREIWVDFVPLPSCAPMVSVTDVSASCQEDWRTSILKYLEEGLLPKDKYKAHLLKKKAAQYCERGGVLYKRSFKRLLL